MILCDFYLQSCEILISRWRRFDGYFEFAQLMSFRSEIVRPELYLICQNLAVPNVGLVSSWEHPRDLPTALCVLC